MSLVSVMDYQAAINHLDTLPTVLAQAWVMENYAGFSDKEMMSLWAYCEARVKRYRDNYKKAAEDDAILFKRARIPKAA